MFGVDAGVIQKLFQEFGPIFFDISVKRCPSSARSRHPRLRLLSSSAHKNNAHESNRARDLEGILVGDHP